MEINLETGFLVPNMFSKVSVSHEAFWPSFFCLFCLFAFVSKLISFSVQLENKNE